MTVQASSFNTPFEALFDRTAWLKARIGSQYLLGIYNYKFNTTATAPGVDQFNSFTSTSWAKPGAGGLIDVPSAIIGDTYVIDCSYGWMQGVVGGSELRLYLIRDPSGTPIELSGGIPGTRSYHESSTANKYHRAAISVSYTEVAGGNVTTRVGIEGIVASGVSLNVQSSLSIRVLHFRTP